MEMKSDALWDTSIQNSLLFHTTPGGERGALFQFQHVFLLRRKNKRMRRPHFHSSFNFLYASIQDGRLSLFCSFFFSPAFVYVPWGFLCSVWGAIFERLVPPALFLIFVFLGNLRTLIFQQKIKLLKIKGTIILVGWALKNRVVFSNFKSKLSIFQ